MTALTGTQAEAEKAKPSTALVAFNDVRRCAAHARARKPRVAGDGRKHAAAPEASAHGANPAEQGAQAGLLALSEAEEIVTESGRGHFFFRARPGPETANGLQKRTEARQGRGGGSGP